jgi:antitoxin HicB
MTVKQIAPVEPPHPFEAYAHIVSPLPAEEGGGYLFTVPDLPGCISDGATVEEAVVNGRDAFESWVAACLDAGEPVPAPAFRPQPAEQLSGKFVARVPKSIHASLVARARAEGVSLNTLVIALIAEGLGRQAGRSQAPG